MADEQTEKVKSLAEALKRVFGADVDLADDELWTLRASELLEEAETEGLIIE